MQQMLSQTNEPLTMKIADTIVTSKIAFCTPSDVTKTLYLGLDIYNYED